MFLTHFVIFVHHKMTKSVDCCRCLQTFYERT